MEGDVMRLATDDLVNALWCIAAGAIPVCVTVIAATGTFCAVVNMLRRML